MLCVMGGVKIVVLCKLLLGEGIAYETFLGYDEVKEQLVGKQGEEDVLEVFERYRYKMSFKQFIPLKHYWYTIKNCYSTS